MDLVNELFEELKNLDNLLTSMAQEGKKLAACERQYKEALAKKTAELRDANVAVGIIDKRIYGESPVAELREKRDVQEIIHNYFYEKLLTTKIRVRVLQSQIEREWSHASK
jgi:hypothetical protein